MFNTFENSKPCKQNLYTHTHTHSVRAVLGGIVVLD